MSAAFDVIVVGQGAWGASAAWALAARGLRVLGLDAFEPPHEFGSHTGTTRLARWSTSQDVAYAPLTKRAFELWRTLEWQTGEMIVETSGSLLFGPLDLPVRQVPLDTLNALGMPYEELGADEVAERFPALWCPQTEGAIFEPLGARLRSADAIRAMQRRARELGATIRFGERVASWSAQPGAVRVVTEHATYEAASLVLCAGARAAHLMPSIAAEAMAERQVLVFFNPRRADTTIPCLYWWQLHDSIPLRGYGAFETDGRFKVAFHRGGVLTDADAVDRTVSQEEVRPIADAVAQRIPGLDPTVIDARVCLYTSAPDEHWVVDRHPKHDNVAFATSCNGRGFRYATAVGELLADLILDPNAQAPPHIRWSRFPGRS